MYPWGDAKITSNDAVFNQVDGPRPVCGKTKTEFGLCDMIGNVASVAQTGMGSIITRTRPARIPRVRTLAFTGYCAAAHGSTSRRFS